MPRSSLSCHFLCFLLFAIISYGYMLIAPPALQALDSYGVTCTTGGTLVRDGESAGDCTITLPAHECDGSKSGARCGLRPLS